jgi:hypothetical protein
VCHQHLFLKHGDFALVRLAEMVRIVHDRQRLIARANVNAGGHCKPDSHKSIAELAHRYGVEAAAEVAAFENVNLKAVKKYIEDEKVDCNFVTTRAFDVQMTESIHKADLEGYRFLRKEGVPSSFDVSYNGSEHVTNVSQPMLPSRSELISVSQVCGIKDARSCYSYEAAHLWPYKLVHHMFTRAVAQGVNLQTNTKVTDIAKQANSPQKWEVRTSRGVVRARKVVVMTNAYTSSILPEYKGVIIPYRAICARIMPEGNAPPLLNTYGIRFSSWDHDYLVPRPDGSIIVGGARSEFFKDLKQWYGRTDDNLLIEPARHYFDDYMQRHFKGWESVTTKVTHLWTGSKWSSALNITFSMFDTNYLQ